MSDKAFERITPRHTQGIWHTYDMTDGLPGGVWQLAQIADGRLWLAAALGLCCYDGTSFTTYTRHEGLIDTRVMAMCGDTQGTLWVGTPSGLVCFDGQRFSSYTKEDGLRDNWVTALYIDREDGLWVGTSKGLCYFDGEGFTQVTDADSRLDHPIRALYQDTDGTLWISSQQALCAWRDGQCQAYTAEDGLAGQQIHALDGDGRGRVWLATDVGLSRFDGQSFINYTRAHGLPCDHVSRLTVDHQGRVWCVFGLYGSGIACFDGERFHSYTHADGLLSDRVDDVLQDHEGQLWCAHLLSGLSCFALDGIQWLTDVPVSEMLMQDSRQRLWFSSDQELYCLEGEDQRHRAFDALIYSIQEDAEGAVWVGTAGDGLYRFQDAEAVWHSEGTHYTSEHGLPSQQVMSLLETRDGTLWAGTVNPGNLCRWNGNTFECIPVPHPAVTRLIEDSQGRLWLGGWSGGGLSCHTPAVSSLGQSTLVTYTAADGFGAGNVQSLVEDAQGHLWVGTEQGLYWFDGHRFERRPDLDGRFDLMHQWSARDYRGHLWFGTLVGGVHRLHGNSLQMLTTQDGLPNNTVSGLIPQPDGSMLIGTYGGTVHYTPIDSPPPRVEIHTVTADTLHHYPSELTLTTTQADLVTIAYRGISLATRKMRYRTRLLGHESSWQNTWESQKTYSKLPVGDYTFQVVAIHRDLMVSEAPATLRLRVEPDPRTVQLQVLQTEVEQLRHAAGSKYHFEHILGRSTVMKQVRVLMERAIDSGLNVLISGETGTGKELVAKAIHYHSQRRDQPLLEVNCGAIPRELAASMLFGHRRGAFTGAMEDRMGLFEGAHGGTLLLDEIAEMPLELQPHLLRVLQEHRVQRVGEHETRPVDVRLIVMTNRDLLAEMHSKRFRQDLYYRLAEFPIALPPLRERPDDIPLLAEHFRQETSEEMERPLGDFTPEAFDLLEVYPWPGNVRELRNEVRRACALVEEERPVLPSHFSSQVRREGFEIEGIPPDTYGYSEAVTRFQRRLLERVLTECDGNKREAARRLQMDRSNLRRLLKRLGIE